MYFNPRSHEGSDIRHCGHLLEYPHFNPRSHEGSDSLLNFSIVSAKGISIHAPTRGATIFSGAACADREYFNPRSHEGSDIALFCMAVTIAYFNPRSHEGSDVHRHYNKFIKKLFQSTLPRGERQCPLGPFFSHKSISIHAPTRGATAIFAKKFSFLSAKIV